MTTSASIRILLCAGAWALLAGTAVRSDEQRSNLDFFEREVHPVLARCLPCHGPDKQESELRLDTRAGMLRGGISGPAVVPGDAERSSLIAAIKHLGDIKMPPQGKLAEPQIASLVHWVKLGAPWPDQPAAGAHAAEAWGTHWAFQPLRDPPVPSVPGNSSPNPIDAFIRARLAASGLTTSPIADGRTLARRVSGTLTGLPPELNDAEALQRDAGNDAYALLVDRLLACPEYGEHWARQWLDLARYSDTKGYVYAREHRSWVHAWVYRDWVVRALNEDLPYDQFLLLQIAADQAAPGDRSSLAAMGFLTLGRRFLGVSRDIIDDRIDVVTRSTMGLTVACARCHDHKYDPIPTSDYYSLYGIFQSCAEQLLQISEPAEAGGEYQKHLSEFATRQQKLGETMAERRLETANRNRARAGDYLAAQLELHKYPVEGFDQILSKSDLLPTFVRRWQAYLYDARKRADPIFAPWHAYFEIEAGEFAARAMEVTDRLLARAPDHLNSLVMAQFSVPPASMAEVAARYGEVFAAIDRKWQDSLKTAADAGQLAPSRLPDEASEALRRVLYDANGPCEVPDEPLVNIEYFFDTGTCEELWKLQREVDNWILQSPREVRYAVVLRDRDRPATPRVFRRGDPTNLGDEIPRQFVAVVAGPDRHPFSLGSGRLELAQAIIDPRNPLTARVIVNRVWAHHFATGLVPTTSDFGTRADPPSHPELLDWLATRLIEDGWSLKKLHRRILLSETYRQSAHGPVDEPQLARARQVDPENRLLWRMNERRISFEEMRDAMLSVAGLLDRAIGGRPGSLASPRFTRRTLYGEVDRQFLPSTLRVFDFANPDIHIPQRSDTTTPQQALFFLNHPLVIGYAEALAARTADVASDEERVQRLYGLAYQRRATPGEIRSALAFLRRAAREDPEIGRPVTAAAWQYGLGAFDEAAQRTSRFERLPHFTGSAWQGGTDYPDGRLGWAQLTAIGGHPGNDLAHASIRRWTAPRAMEVSVESLLVHKPEQGEGVRGFLVSSRDGLLAQAKVHHGQAELNVESLSVHAGDTLDFVADIGQKLAHNEFEWKAKITPVGEPGNEFDSQRDFSSHGIRWLEPWAQLAQVLLSANEFVFVD